MALVPLFRAFADLLAPRACAACEIPLEPAEEGFCGGCVILLDPVPEALRPPAFHAAACVFGGPLADALRRMKYGNRPELVSTLGAVLAEASTPLAGRVDVVVPVPLHPTRLRRRGFNQATLLARPVARRLGVPLRPGLLRRVRDTPAQAGLGSVARADNVRGAFLARVPAGARVLLVDDVRTTGATLAEAAACLREGGAREVRTLVLAQADRTA